MSSNEQATATGDAEKVLAASGASVRASSRHTELSKDDFGSKEPLEPEEEEEDDDTSRREGGDVLTDDKDVENATAAPVAKKDTRVSVNDLSRIPNGGLLAWLQVLGTFFLFYNTWGITNTYGVYQTYYELELLRDTSPSAISWIGSIQAFMLMLVGTATGPLYDAGYFRELLWFGAFFVVFGHMMLSLCKEYWQVLLAQAFCIGAGMGTLFVPGVAIISTYFSTKIAIATGIAAAGSSLGMLFPT